MISGYIICIDRSYVKCNDVKYNNFFINFFLIILNFIDVIDLIFFFLDMDECVNNFCN